MCVCVCVCVRVCVVKGGEISLKKENTTMKTPEKSSKLSSATRGSANDWFRRRLASTHAAQMQTATR